MKTRLLEIQLRSVKCLAVTRMCNDLEKRFISIKRGKWLQCLNANKPLQEGFKHIYYNSYLFKCNDISIMLLLTDNLTNICGEIGKIRINLWIIYTDTCNVKELEGVEQTSGRWMYFALLTKIIRDVRL